LAFYLFRIGYFSLLTASFLAAHMEIIFKANFSKYLFVPKELIKISFLVFFSG